MEKEQFVIYPHSENEQIRSNLDPLEEASDLTKRFKLRELDKLIVYHEIVKDFL